MINLLYPNEMEQRLDVHFKIHMSLCDTKDKTQTSLISYEVLEISDIETREVDYTVKQTNKVAEQSVQINRLMCPFISIRCMM